MKCPHCEACNTGKQGVASTNSDIKKYGAYKRKSDSRTIQRFYCKRCQKTYSTACNDPAYHHNKRRINNQLKRLLASNVSLRRSAILLGVSRTTIARKLVYLGGLCDKENAAFLAQHEGSVDVVQFDELHTIEHTKCKPVSIVVAIAAKNRKILGITVARTPATGLLAKISRQKYGPRPDERPQAIHAVFEKIKTALHKKVIFQSDKHPYYKPIITYLFPQAKHVQSTGDAATISGQGELKKNARDPLFAINHTLAMLRANINRLIRRTWCTTKNLDRLRDHLAIYMAMHNAMLTP